MMMMISSSGFYDSSTTTAVQSLRTLLGSRFELPELLEIEIMEKVLTTNSGSITIPQTQFVTKPVIVQEENGGRILEVFCFYFDDLTLRWKWVTRREDEEEKVDVEQCNDYFHFFTTTLSVTLETENCFVCFDSRKDTMISASISSYLDMLIPDIDTTFLCVTLFFQNLTLTIERDEVDSNIPIALNELAIVLKQLKGPMDMTFRNRPPTSHDNDDRENDNNTRKEEKQEYEDIFLTLDKVIPLQITVNQIMVPKLMRINQFVMTGFVDTQTRAFYSLKIPSCLVHLIKCKETKETWTSFQEHFKEKELWIDNIHTPFPIVEEIQFQFAMTGAAAKAAAATAAAAEKAAEKAAKKVAAAASSAKNKIINCEVKQSSNKANNSTPALNVFKKILNKYEGTGNDTIATIACHYTDVFVERITSLEGQQETIEKTATEVTDKVGGYAIRLALHVSLITPLGAALNVAAVVAQETVKKVHKSIRRRTKEYAAKRGKIDPKEVEEKELTWAERQIREYNFKARMFGAVGASIGAALCVTVFAGPAGLLVGAVMGGFISEQAAAKLIAEEEMKKEASVATALMKFPRDGPNLFLGGSRRG